MIAVEMLPAGHGDALVVEYGSGSDVRRLLIDAGTIHSYDRIRGRLLARSDRKYDAFVITHVDEDHIGGAVPLLEDPDLRHRIRNVWFNGYAHVKQGGNVLGPVDGERLTRAICDGGYQWNEPFKNRVSPAVGGPIVVPTAGDLPSIALEGGAKLVLLSPSGKKLERMAAVWMDVVTEAGLVPGRGTDRVPNSPKPHRKRVKALPETMTAAALKALAGPTRTDASEANGSSIAFILEHGHSRALFAADANPAVLVSALRRYAAMKGESRVRLDICKLPHHGSRANVTTDLLKAIDTRRYLVSTDGMSFGHPDDAAMARILHSSAAPAQIYCNYASERTRDWVKRAEAADGRVILPESDGSPVRVEAA
jgi:beta-lactamase superfamily II metal-dependent hydrolase